MTLIVETGTASSTSEAYASVSYCDTYHSNIGNATWAGLSTVAKEQALRRAAMFMCQSYRMRWKGYRVNASQSLDWPRYDASLPDLGVVNIVLPDTVPPMVLEANAALALIASLGELNPSQSQGVLSKQIGPIKIVYDSSSPQGKKYISVEDILRPLFREFAGSNFLLRRV